MRERSSLGIEHFWEGSWVDAFCSSALFVSDTVTSTSRTFWTSWTSWTCPNHAEERLLDSEFRCEDFLWFRRYNSFFFVIGNPVQHIKDPFVRETISLLSGISTLFHSYPSFHPDLNHTYIRHGRMRKP